METKKIILTNTVVYKGRHYPPDSEQDWPADVVDELIEKDAAELVLEVAGQDPQRKEKIIFAAQQAADEEKVTAAGVPTVSAIEEILGFGVTGAERDEAWETIQQEQESDA
jgi:hypothetical protein